MHNARSSSPADAGQALAAMSDQGVDERAALMPGGRMHHEPSRLVDDQQIAILENDRERDVLARWLGWDGGRNRDGDDFVPGKAAPRIVDRPGPDRHRSGQDERFQPGARQIGPCARETPVQALAFVQRSGYKLAPG